MLDNWTAENVVRWRRQALTLYKDLSEKEKDSDRARADAILKALAQLDTPVSLSQANDTNGEESNNEVKPTPDFVGDTTAVTQYEEEP